jgi:uncharacterized coiled-coil DUF342 family protein
MNTDTPETDAENDLQCELAAWELLREAQAENIGWQNKWQVAVEMAALAQNELAAVTAQRDEARETIATMEIRHAAVMLHTQSIVDEANQFREQRDRLAEALRYCREDSAELLGERDWWQSEPRCDYAKRWQETHDNLTRADEALQSLTQNAKI